MAENEMQSGRITPRYPGYNKTLVFVDYKLHAFVFIRTSVNKNQC